MENIRQKLISEQQIKKIQALLSNLYDKAKAEEARERIKKRYVVPSFWQLSKEEASEIIEKLVAVEENRMKNQPKLL